MRHHGLTASSLAFFEVENHDCPNGKMKQMTRFEKNSFPNSTKQMKRNNSIKGLQGRWSPRNEASTEAQSGGSSRQALPNKDARHVTKRRGLFLGSVVSLEHNGFEQSLRQSSSAFFSRATTFSDASLSTGCSSCPSTRAILPFDGVTQLFPDPTPIHRSASQCPCRL